MGFLVAAAVLGLSAFFWGDGLPCMLSIALMIISVLCIVRFGGSKNLGLRRGQDI
jgi:hypothetical protein